MWRELLRPGMHVVEVGANVGAHTLPLAHITRNVSAIEPQEYLFRLLRANCAMSCPDVGRCARVAVGSATKKILLPTLDPAKSQNFGGVGADRNWEFGQETHLITLDGHIEGSIDFLKIDCEGTELQVLEGAIMHIRRSMPLIYLEFAEQRAPLLSLLQSEGYSMVRHLPAHERTPNFLGAPLSSDRNFCSDMLLAWHPLNAPQVEVGFGMRHLFTHARDEEILGTMKEFERVEPVFAPATQTAHAHSVDPHCQGIDSND